MKLMPRAIVAMILIAFPAHAEDRPLTASWSFTAPLCPQYPAAIADVCAAPGAGGILTICERKSGVASQALRPLEQPGEIVCVNVKWSGKATP
jgi:hypothetical protein